MFYLNETAFSLLTWGNVLMYFLGGAFIYLGIRHKMEPLLFLPIGFGIIMANLPLAGLMVFTPAGLPAEIASFNDLLPAITGREIGLLNLLYTYGIKTEVLPLLLFLGLGALTDFGPTIARPTSFIFGAAAQLGVFAVFFIAYVSGLFTIEEAASIGIIGGSAGPPTIAVANALAPHLLGPITLVAYSYMALVPIIQPPVIKLLCSRKERAIYMKPQAGKVSKLQLVIFPVLIFIIASLLVPKSAPLVGMFMFGNLLRVSGVTDRLGQSASGVFIDVLTFLLGLTVGSLMTATVFFTVQTITIIILAMVAFSIGTASGVLSAKLTNLFLKNKINPMIGAAGLSAIPMAARVVQKMGQEANPKNFLLMHAMGANMAGAIAISIVAGVILGMLG